MKKIMVFIAFILSSALAGPSDNTLVIGTSQQPSAMDPFVNTQAITGEVLGFLFAGLTYFDFNGVLRPNLAERVPSEENGDLLLQRDAKGNVVAQKIRWRIRPDAKWSDGRPISSEDFRMTFEIYSDPQLEVAVRRDSPKTFKVIDDRSFELEYDPTQIVCHFQLGFRAKLSTTSPCGQTDLATSQRAGKWQKHR